MLEKFKISKNKPSSPSNYGSIETGVIQDNEFLGTFHFLANENDFRNISGKGIETRSVNIKFINTMGSNREVLNDVVDFLDGDVYISFNYWYCKAKVEGIEFKDYLLSDSYIDLKVTFKSNWVWCIDTVIEYDPEKWQQVTGDRWRDYSSQGRGYNYGYTTDINFSLDIDRQYDFDKEAYVEVTFFGECENPYIQWGIKKIGVKDNIEYGEYLTINTKEKTVYKYQSDRVVNKFYSRMKFNTHSVFDKIQLPTTITAKHGLKFRLIITKERRSPLWI